MLKECIIIGGGVAGLSSGIRLTELGIFPLIIESSTYPAHRMCGQFFSPEALPILERWGIHFHQTINRASLIVGKHTIEFSLQNAAASMSRYDFDLELLNKAKKVGCEVLTETPVLEIKEVADPLHETLYEVILVNGQRYVTPKLIIGTGRFSDKKQPLVYRGYKAHFSGIKMGRLIEMHCFAGGYVGVSSIGDDEVNVACLVKKSHVNDVETFMSDLFARKGMERFAERLERGKMSSQKWMTGELPEFGIRVNENKKNLYWIGDAAGVIPPICGDGLGMAVTSGVMAAEYMAKEAFSSFSNDWHRRYAPRIALGKILHGVITRPWTYSLVAGLCKGFPSIPSSLYRLTRE